MNEVQGTVKKILDISQVGRYWVVSTECVAWGATFQKDILCYSEQQAKNIAVGDSIIT